MGKERKELNDALAKYQDAHAEATQARQRNQTAMQAAHALPLTAWLSQTPEYKKALAEWQAAQKSAMTAVDKEDLARERLQKAAKKYHEFKEKQRKLNANTQAHFEQWKKAKAVLEDDIFPL